MRSLTNPFLHLLACYACLLLPVAPAPGQVYTFSKGSAAYQPLRNPQLENLFDEITASSVSMELGFRFRYYDRYFTKLEVFDEGLIAFTNGPITSGSHIMFCFSGYANDIDDYGEVDAKSEIKYETTGNPGNQVFTLEYNTIALLDKHRSVPHNLVGVISYQLKLYENNGDIEIHFGNSIASPGSLYPSYTGIYNVFPALRGLGVYGYTHDLKITPLVLDDFGAYGLLGIPPAGTVYRFGFDRDLTWNNLPGVGWDVINGMASGSGSPNSGFVNGDVGGALLGHNRYKDREFAEKYYLSEKAVVKGMASQHYGSATSEALASFSLYAAGPDGLPGAQLAQQRVPYRCLNREGALNYVPFDTFTAVQDSFFVAFGLAPYEQVSGDTLGLYYISADPAQPGITAFGRTAARWFDGRWYDVYSTKMLTNRVKGYAFTDSSALDLDLVHLALFPVINFNVASTGALAGNLNCPADGRVVTGLAANYAARGDLRLHPCYPNPAVGQVCIPFSLQRPGRVTLAVFDALGRPVYQGQHAFGSPGLQRVYLDTGHYPGGVYTAVVRTGQSVLATQFAVHP